MVADWFHCCIGSSVLDLKSQRCLKAVIANRENKALCASNSTSLQPSASLSPSHSLCLSRPCSLSPPCNWQAPVMEVNSMAAILMPSTPTYCQLELLAVSDDGAIKRDVRGLSDRWIHASSVLIKPSHCSTHSWHASPPQIASLSLKIPQM